MRVKATIEVDDHYIGAALLREGELVMFESALCVVSKMAGEGRILLRLLQENEPWRDHMARTIYHDTYVRKARVTFIEAL